MCTRSVAACAITRSRAAAVYCKCSIRQHSNVHSTAATAMNRFIDLHNHTHTRETGALTFALPATPTLVGTRARVHSVDADALSSSVRIHRSDGADVAHRVDVGRMPQHHSTHTIHVRQTFVSSARARALRPTRVCARRRAVGGRRYICSERSRKTFSSSAISGRRTSQLRFRHTVADSLASPPRRLPSDSDTRTYARRIQTPHTQYELCHHHAAAATRENLCEPTALLRTRRVQCARSTHSSVYSCSLSAPTADNPSRQCFPSVQNNAVLRDSTLSSYHHRQLTSRRVW